MKTSSAKAKGRRLQQEVRTILIETLKIHPEDIESWLQALNSLMKFTLSEIPKEKRKDASYTWNFRFKNAQGTYVNIIQNTTPLIFDSENKPIIGLAHYTVLHPDVK